MFVYINDAPPPSQAVGELCICNEFFYIFILVAAIENITLSYCIPFYTEPY